MLALSTLLENAVKHAVEDSPIRLEVEAGTDELRYQVINDEPAPAGRRLATSPTRSSAHERRQRHQGGFGIEEAGLPGGGCHGGHLTGQSADGRPTPACSTFLPATARRPGVDDEHFGTGGEGRSRPERRDRLHSQLGEFSVSSAATIREAEACSPSPYDLLILDINLPDGDGLTFCRARYIRSGIVMYTGRGERELRIASLRDGADAYLVKPDEPGGARSHAAERASSPEQQRAGHPLQAMPHPGIWIWSAGCWWRRTG